MYKLKRGHDGYEYCVFESEAELSEWCATEGIEVQTFCFDGFHNAFRAYEIDMDKETW